MAFYIFQARYGFAIKAGYAETEAGVSDRGKSHSTAAGPQVLLGTIPHAARVVETEILRRLRPFTLRDAEGNRRYEVCLPCPDVLRFIKGAWLKEQGYIRVHNPRDPRSQTTKDWLNQAQWVGERSGRIARAARHALDENARLREFVPQSARGGWDLNEQIGGQGFLDAQMRFGFAAGRLIDGEEFLIHRCTYRGAVFDFPVFAEWYERQHGKRAPENAVRVGLPIHRAKLESGRKGKPVRRLAPPLALVGQLALGGVR